MAEVEETTALLSTAAKKLDFAPSENEVLVDINNIRFRRCHDTEMFANNLIECQVEELGEGVEWLDLKYGIDIDSAVHSKGLITRGHSRGISAAILSKTEALALSMSFIIGSPGIGKTRTLTFLLRELLKKDTMNVQYFDQKNAKAVVFLRRGGTTYSYRSIAPVPERAEGALFGDIATAASPVKTYILVDPSEKGASFVHPVSSHLIVSCSANVKHYHNIDKEKSTHRYYLGLPSTREMEIIATKLSPEMDKRELLNRINNVGPVPRYVFDDNAYKKRKEEIDRKSRDSKVDAAIVLTALTQGTAVGDDPTLCGALFAHMNVEERNAAGASFTDYTAQNISVLSQYAAWLLYQRFRDAFVQATIKGQDCDTRAVFEKLSSFDLIVGGLFSVCDMRLAKRKKSVKYIPPASAVIKVKPSRPEKETRKVFTRPALLGERSMSTDYDASESFEPKQKRQKLGGPFIILSEGYSSIDFLNTNRQVFQATMGANHDMKGWVELLVDAEILLLSDKGILSINPKAKELEFYWVVPKHQTAWESKKEKVPTKDDIPATFLKQKKIIDAAIARHVHQIVLFIEQVQPVQSEFWSTFVPIRGGWESCRFM